MHRALFVISIVALVGTTPVALQLSPSAKVYRSQYGELKTKAVSLLDRAKDSRPNNLALQEEGLAFAKLVHRLQEEAMRDNLDRTRRGQPSDKTLLLVAQACGALDFMLTAIDNYIDTGDRAFIQLAGRAMGLMDSTEQFF